MANVERTMENLEKRGFVVSRFADREAAARYLLNEVGDTPVGIGGSVTIDEMNLYPRLQERGETYWHWFTHDPLLIDKANAAPIYIMSANGVSESGQIVNIDGRSNRVANMCYGHERVYIVIGVNKIAPSDKLALWRARNIASPKNARRLGNKNTPCKEGDLTCYDCDSPDRICSTFVIQERRPSGIPHYEIVIIDEALGF
ncbi:MAG: lactate utilization protein [Oscillospiraceae bacterium]|nr:lactate utilization protein [Oscillospiraceae bacterium]